MVDADFGGCELGVLQRARNDRGRVVGAEPPRQVGAVGARRDAHGAATTGPPAMFRHLPGVIPTRATKTRVKWF
jgi:hypothetical protein